MKILHIIDSLGLGGAQVIVKRIFEKQKNNYGIFLFAVRRRKITIKINHRNVFVYNSEAKYSLAPLREIKQFIKKNEINILHCHLFRSQVFGYLLKKFYFPKIKLIFHRHGYLLKNLESYFLNRVQKEVNLFIAVSQNTKNKLIENAKIDESKIKVLSNFVDLDKLNSEALKRYDRDKTREKWGIDKKDFVIGFIGRLAEIKGCKYLIKSIPYIKLSLKVIIAGDGPERENLASLCKKLNIQDKVVFLGYIEDILKIYKLIDVLVIPSRSEASPMVFYESQALGVPIIASHIPDLNELIKNNENGLLFEPGNEKDLAEKINLVHNNRKLRKKMVRSGFKGIKECSWPNYLMKLRAAYGEL